jgi:hypothetical protein
VPGSLRSPCHLAIFGGWRKLVGRNGLIRAGSWYWTSRGLMVLEGGIPLGRPSDHLDLRCRRADCQSALPPGGLPIRPTSGRIANPPYLRADWLATISYPSGIRSINSTYPSATLTTVKQKVRNKSAGRANFRVSQLMLHGRAADALVSDHEASKKRLGNQRAGSCPHRPSRV